MARKKIFEETAYKDVSEARLLCGDLKHKWEILTDLTPDVRKFRGRRIKVYTRLIQCERCGTKREDAFDHNLDRVLLDYEYPPGYLVSRSVEGIRGARALRIESLTRKGLLP